MTSWLSTTTDRSRGDRQKAMTTDDRDDRDLLARLVAGDRRAFDDLYRRYAAPAYGLAVRVTGHQHIAQDVVHDAFSALWRSPDAYDPSRGAFRSFFLALVHHRAVDAVRREERHRKRLERMNQGPQVDEDVAEGVVEKDWLAERRDEVRRALSVLSPEQRQVVEMMYFSGLTQARISEMTGIPLGTVKTRAFAAMHKLRRALKGDD